MTSSELDPSSAQRRNREAGLDPNRVTSSALATFLSVMNGFANNLPHDHLQGVVAQGVASFEAAIAGGNVPPQQRTRAAIALELATRMTGGDARLSDVEWVRDPFLHATRRVRNNGSPVIIRPAGTARRAGFAVIAVPGNTSDEAWRLYRREASQGGYAMVELTPDSGDLVRLGSDDDAQNGVYGFTTLTGRNTTSAYAAYICHHHDGHYDGRHATVEVAPGELVVQDHSFLGTAVEHIIGEPSSA